MSSSPDTVLVVGFPGVVARKVAIQLASSKNVKVALLAANEDLEEARQFAASQKVDLEIIEGSFVKIDFGLTGKEYLELASRVSTVLFCVLPDPPGSSSEKTKTRTAAREVIELAKAADTPPRILFLSHFDVSGDTPGVFAEQDLILGQEFYSEAAEERFRAERVLGRFDNQIPITIVRAGWIVGQEKGLCPLVELLLSHDDLSNMSPRAVKCTLPFIHVDSVAELLAGITVSSSGGEKQILHLTYEGIPELEQLVEMTRELAEHTLPRGFDLTHVAKSVLKKDESKERWSTKEFFKHLGEGTRFSTGRTKRILQENGLSAPQFKEHFPQLVKEAALRMVDRKR